MNDKLLAGLYKRGSVYWFSWTIAGQRYRESLGTADEGQAVLRALALRSSPGQMLARQLEREIDEYFAERRRLGKMRAITANSQRGILRNFQRSSGVMTLGDLTPTAIAQWDEARRAKVTPAAADLGLKVMRAFCRWLTRKGLLRVNPADACRPASDKTPARIEFATAEQADRLISAAPSARFKFILLAGFDGGLRRNEIVEARRDWFNLDVGSLAVRAGDTFTPKNGRNRVVPMTARFVEFMREQFAAIPPSSYIIDPEREQKSAHSPRVNINPEFTAFMEERGEPWITPHTMRRTFASLRVSAGVSIYKVAAWLGDRLATTERHYAHLVHVDSDIERVHRPQFPA
ncbi:MAG: tyrosine-type recombinase/integrase [Chthoniobacteraceae bacterium]